MAARKQNRKTNRKRAPVKRLKNQRAAYKPRAKKQQQMRRQPFVETKKTTYLMVQDEVLNLLKVPQTPEGVADPTAARYRQWKNHNISPINQFLFLSRGTGDNQMIGRDIYSKYLKQKIQIKLPAGILPDTRVPTSESNRPFNRITQPIQIYIVWGWLKQPMGTARQNVAPTPPATQAPPVSVAVVKDQIDHITDFGNRLLGNLQTRGTRESDFLTFKDRRP